MGNAHLGFDRTYSAIRSRYFWPRMYSDIDIHVRTCNTCQKSKRNYGNDKASLSPLPVPARPFSRLHIDILGPLTSSSEDHKYILLVVCAFTGWCECFPLKTQESSVIAQILYAEIFCRFGAPDILVSDREKTLCPNWYRHCVNFFKLLGILQAHSTRKVIAPSKGLTSP